MKPFIDFGEPTYRHYYIYQAFEDKKQTEARWGKDIIRRMSRLLFESIFHPKTDYSNFSVVWKAKAYVHVGEESRPTRYIRFDIGMYHDGFHITVDLNDLPRDVEVALKKKVFGDINRSSGFTKEIAKVAPIANDMFEYILDFLENYKKDANT